MNIETKLYLLDLREKEALADYEVKRAESVFYDYTRKNFMRDPAEYDEEAARMNKEAAAARVKRARARVAIESAELNRYIADLMELEDE